MSESHVPEPGGPHDTATAGLPTRAPTASPDPDRTRDASPPPPGGGCETILFVECDARMREVGRRVLASHGYTVLTAEDGLLALACYHGHAGRVDLVIAELAMPRIHGPALYDALHGRTGAVKFLFTSGYGGATAQRLLWCDVPFLQKPWGDDELVRAVRQVLDG